MIINKRFCIGLISICGIAVTKLIKNNLNLTQENAQLKNNLQNTKNRCTEYLDDIWEARWGRLII